jgi:hypothetical protein
MVRVLGDDLSQLLHICQLKFVLAWVQKVPAKSQSSGFRKILVPYFRLAQTDLLSCRWLQAWPEQTKKGTNSPEKSDLIVSRK